jgi:hypothetical protein
MLDVCSVELLSLRWRVKWTRYDVIKLRISRKKSLIAMNEEDEVIKRSRRSDLAS